MGQFLLSYGALRGNVLKYRKFVGAAFGVMFFVFLIYTYMTEGRMGQVRSTDLNHDGPDLFESLGLLSSFNTEELEQLAIGHTGLSPFHSGKAVENLLELEQEAILRERTHSNTSIVNNKPIFDKNGNEIGLRFLVLSDWGGESKSPYTTHTQMNVGKAMAEASMNYDCSFIISLGDNFCDSGVRDIDDLRFEDTFEDVFTQGSLQRPWYVIAGDKDYKGNVSAQIAYTNRSRRWSFESKYYKMTANLPTYRNISVDFVLIDTVQLCGRIPSKGYRQPMGPMNVTAAEKQWAWIDHTLKTSGAEYVIVGGHYPVFSGGRYGSTRCLEERLKPMLEKHRVSAYIGGHDHSVQHIKDPGDGGVHYFVAGASTPEDDHPEHLDGLVASTRYFWTNHVQKDMGAFLYCDVRKNSMSVSFIRSDQVNLYVATILPRSHPENRKQKQKFNVAPIPILKHHSFKPKPRNLFHSNPRKFQPLRRQPQFVKQPVQYRPARAKPQSQVKRYRRPL